MLSDTNPFLCRDFGTPHSTFPFDKIRYEHYEPAIEAGMNEEMDEIARITACKDEPTFDNTILALEQAGGTLETVTTVMGNFLNALATDELHAIAERQMPSNPPSGWLDTKVHSRPSSGRFSAPFTTSLASRKSRQAFRKSTPTLSFDSRRNTFNSSWWTIRFR